MTPWLLFQFMATPPTRVYPILDRHGIALRFQVSLLFSSVFSVVVGGIIFESLIMSVILISALNSIIYLARLMTTYSLVGMSWYRPLTRLLAATPWAILCNVPFIILWLVEGEVAFSTFFSFTMLFSAVVSLGVFMIHKVKEFGYSGRVSLEGRA